ncbi:DUF4352 domain-containing protein [Spirillospora sp. NPDC029432]|uniref:DUF4352 domain-containing protein n=1 Tax=Spirillospora sp. NPDC029432 TaxID=3154599 RepID=UPI003451E972
MRTILTGLGLLGALTFTGCAVETEPTEVQSAGDEAKPAEKVPVKLTAEKTAFEPSAMSDGGDYTCAKVTVTNRTTKNLDVNPLDFALTGADGTKHDIGSAFGVHEDEIAAVTLAPEEKATGAVCAPGHFTPKTVTFAPGFAEKARAEVA